MKLSEYIKKLQENIEEHGDMECYYAIDDEGNGYQKINYDGYVRYLTPDKKDCYFVEHVYYDDEFDDLRDEHEYDDEDIENLIKICVVN